MYEPVCAQDKDENTQTFSNQCVFEVAQCEEFEKEWSLVAGGECPDVNVNDDSSNLASSDSCSKICNYNYVPVCGQDKFGTVHSFSNQCEFEVVQCVDSDSGKF